MKPATEYYKQINVFKGFLVGALGITLIGCAAGINSTVQYSESNVGVNVDANTKPVAEVAISRREGTVTPVFEGGQSPAAISSFAANGNFLQRFTFGLANSSTTGDAAIAMAMKATGTLTNDQVVAALKKTGISISVVPQECKALLGDNSGLVGAGHVKPMVFGTDTVFGLSVSWSGSTAAYPSAVKIGYNRKEFIFTPLGLSGNSANGFLVRIPSTLAALHVTTDLNGTPVKTGGSSSTGSTTSSGTTTQTTSSGSDQLEYTQFFAVGDAATYLALQDQIRSILFPTMAGQSASGTGGTTASKTNSGVKTTPTEQTNQKQNN